MDLVNGSNESHPHQRAMNGLVTHTFLVPSLKYYYDGLTSDSLNYNLITKYSNGYGFKLAPLFTEDN